MKILKQINYCILSAYAAIVVSCSPDADSTVHVEIQCDTIVHDSLSLTGYFNNSLRNAPPPELAGIVEEIFGTPEITRCWLALDDMWDYRTGEYRYNYKIGKDYYPGDTVKNPYKSKNPWALELESDILYEDYITGVSRHSKYLLLNVRKYETEVLNGILPLSKWKEVLKNALLHYKGLCPNLRYIELLNESIYPHLGGVKDDEYYILYKAAWQAINEVNAELDPAVPILLGGNTNHYSHGFAQFLKDYEADPDAGKRLDFLSYHEYDAGERPAMFDRREQEVQEILLRYGLDPSTPQFVTEMGYTGRTTEHWTDNFKQATFITSAIYYARNSPQLHLFPWVLYHTFKQTSHVMFDDGLRLTPFGKAMLMMTMHKRSALHATSDGVSDSGTGVHVLASADEQELLVQVWNYSDSTADVSVVLKSIPETFRGVDLQMTSYPIDTLHNNAFKGYGSPHTLDPDETRTVRTEDRLQWYRHMPPFSLCLWVIGKE
jgi:hypothetical protein